MMKISHIIALSALALLTKLSPANAQNTARAATTTLPFASATASFTTTNIAVGVGYSWGRGISTYGGISYPFTEEGLNTVVIGTSTMNDTAEVFYVCNLRDFAGVYGAAGAVAAVVTVGGTAVVLRHSKGVEMRLNTHCEGLEQASPSLA